MGEPNNTINDLYGLRVFGDFNGEIKLSDDLDEISKAINIATTTGQRIYTNDVEKMKNLIDNYTTNTSLTEEIPTHSHSSVTISPYTTNTIDIYEPTILKSQCLEDVVLEYCEDILDKRKEDKNMEILKIYKERKATELLNDYEKKLDKINQENPFEIIIKEAVEQIQELYLNEYDKELKDFILIPPTIGLDKLKTKELIEKENKLTIEYERAVNELNNLIEEVEARLELAEDGAEKVKVLKTYGILDKNSKINA